MKQYNPYAPNPTATTTSNDAPSAVVPSARSAVSRPPARAGRSEREPGRQEVDQPVSDEPDPTERVDERSGRVRGPLPHQSAEAKHGAGHVQS